MNIAPNSVWFTEIYPEDLSVKLIGRLRHIFDTIYIQHASFPSTIHLHNQAFDHYICPYFWILNALANYRQSLLLHIRELLLPGLKYI